jgi:hypothetical protein
MPILSLTEAEALATKAARGAGHPWGLAEEAGMAARWLHDHGHNGLALLADLLTDPMPLCGPIIDRADWRAAPGAMLCPLRTGAALCDFGGLSGVTVGAGIRLHDLGHPALLRPFLARLSAQTGVHVGMNDATPTRIGADLRTVQIPFGYRRNTDVAILPLWAPSPRVPPT